MQCYGTCKDWLWSDWQSAWAIVSQKFLDIDIYRTNVLYLLQNFNYLHWTGNAISAKEHTSAKDCTYSVLCHQLHPPQAVWWAPSQAFCSWQKPLVHKITSGAAHTATELKETLDMGVCGHTIKDTLKQEGLLSKVKVNRPVPSKAHQSIG